MGKMKTNEGFNGKKKHDKMGISYAQLVQSLATGRCSWPFGHLAMAPKTLEPLPGLEFTVVIRGSNLQIKITNKMINNHQKPPKT